MNNHIIFESGTKVTWYSEAGGNGKRKVGSVIAFVPKNTLLPCPIGEDSWGKISRNRLKGQMVSKVDRYLVAVRRNSGLLDFYTPHMSLVEKV
jgi:hypothetical protein